MRKFRMRRVKISKRHGCMVRAATKVKPCMVVRLDFKCKSVGDCENVDMTAVRVNGDMKTAVDIDIVEEASNFHITKEGIKYSKNRIGRVDDK